MVSLSSSKVQVKVIVTQSVLSNSLLQSLQISTLLVQFFMKRLYVRSSFKFITGNSNFCLSEKVQV